jgi:tRNA A37 N6-isopentenylltransferase MiaA
VNQQLKELEYDYRGFVVSVFDRKGLYEKIEIRCEKMIEDGLIEEVKKYKEDLLKYENKVGK